MKTLPLIAIGILAFVLVGCDDPAANFSTDFPVVRGKSQNARQRENGEALYTIVCYTKQGGYDGTVTLLLPENFAKVNEHLYFNGTNMFAGPLEAESNYKR